MTRICTCRSADWHVEPCPDEHAGISARALFFGALFSAPLWGVIALVVQAVRP